MVKKSDALFQLVKSLSRGEKRNFRMLAQLTSGDKKYLQLFDAIDKLSDYDEEKIIKSFRKDPKFVRQLSYNKNYLYNNILNSLSYFYKGQEAELSTLSLQVRILMDKNLYAHARKLLRKVKDKVTVQEKFEDLLKILRLEMDISRNTQPVKIFEKDSKQIEFEEKVAVEKLVNLQAFRKLEKETLILLKTIHVARKEDELASVSRLMDNELLTSETEALSVKAKILYQEIHRRLKFFAGENEASMAHTVRSIELYENNPEIIDGDKEGYLRQLIHLGVNQFTLENYESAVPVVQKLYAVDAQTPRERLIQYNGRLLELGMRIDSGVQAGVEDLIMNIEVELDYLINDLSTVTILNTYFYLAQYYTLTGEYSDALKWINKFINHPRTNIRTDMQCIARILNLIIHFELGHYDLLEYSIKSTYRFIYKQERMYNYERRLLRFLKGLINVVDLDEMEDRFVELKADLEKIFEDPFEARALNLFNTLAWLDAKIQGKLPIEIVRETSQIKEEIFIDIKK